MFLQHICSVFDNVSWVKMQKIVTFENLSCEMWNFQSEKLRLTDVSINQLIVSAEKVSKEFFFHLKIWLSDTFPHRCPFQSRLLSSINNIGQGVRVSGSALTLAHFAKHYRRPVGVLFCCVLCCCGRPSRPSVQAAAADVRQDKPELFGVTQQFGPEIEQSWTHDTPECFFFFHTPWAHQTLSAPLPPFALSPRIDVPVIPVGREQRGVSHALLAVDLFANILSLIALPLSFLHRALSVNASSY